MNLNYFFLFLCLISCSSNNETTQITKISCGQCQFGLSTQKGCDLAIRIDGKAHFVDGVHIDDFGDAHDLNSGFCEVIRTAKISGNLIEGRFQASSIELVKE
jgi:hypothetical protein